MESKRYVWLNELDSYINDSSPLRESIYSTANTGKFPPWYIFKITQQAANSKIIQELYER